MQNKVVNRRGELAVIQLDSQMQKWRFDYPKSQVTSREGCADWQWQLMWHLIQPQCPNADCQLDRQRFPILFLY